jgi:hypothetical protein
VRLPSCFSTNSADLTFSQFTCVVNLEGFGGPKFTLFLIMGDIRFLISPPIDLKD